MNRKHNGLVEKALSVGVAIVATKNALLVMLVDSVPQHTEVRFD